MRGYMKKIKGLIKRIMPEKFLGIIKRILYKGSKLMDHYMPKRIKYRGVVKLSSYDSVFPDFEMAIQRLRFGPLAYLLAYGGQLSVERYVEGVRRGILPFFTDKDPYLWWIADKRCIVPLEAVKIDRAVKNIFKKHIMDITVDQAYDSVLMGCRDSHEGYVWLTDERMGLYRELFAAGYSHSIEVWQDGDLVGGLIGYNEGRYFLIETKYGSISNASKYAFAAICIRLKESGYSICDCGHWPTTHLERLGAKVIEYQEFFEVLDDEVMHQCPVDDWEKLFENWDSEEAYLAYYESYKKK